VAYRSAKFENWSCWDDQYPSCQCSAVSLLSRTAINLIYLIFWKLPRREFGSSGYNGVRLPQFKKKLDFYIGLLLKWAQISVRNLNLDLDCSESFLLDQDP
jgi:uncharacterized protein YsxB (DUF464 family)